MQARDLIEAMCNYFTGVGCYIFFSKGAFEDILDRVHVCSVLREFRGMGKGG